LADTLFAMHHPWLLGGTRQCRARASSRHQEAGQQLARNVPSDESKKAHTRSSAAPSRPLLIFGAKSVTWRRVTARTALPGIAQSIHGRAGQAAEPDSQG